MKTLTLVIRILVLINLMFLCLMMYSQPYDSLNTGRRELKINGYIKDLQRLSFIRNSEQTLDQNLIHNRINLRYNYGSAFSAAAEFRNRIFWGEAVRLNSNFSQQLENPSDFFDLSVSYLKRPDLLMHTNIDRIWLQFSLKHFETRLGRQRINWGIGTLWNPNDIFNTYNFLDFDYEERPGRDAVKFTYKFGGMSNIELAIATSEGMKQQVIALKYFFNKQYYDFQFIAGQFNDTVTLGGGWSGRIENIGFKGECQYFFSHKEKDDLLNITLEADYLLENSWYLGGGLLFNSYGVSKPQDNWETISFELSPKNLMPTKWNATLTVRKQFTPLFTTGLTTIYSPGTNLFLVLPGLSYNIATNLDLDFVMQSFFAEFQNTFNGLSHNIFLRTKWSF
ncbi:hypothetical protein V8G61_09065 [Gaetbulibacter sp. M240]|uniref:hypothetical protein n=1 Tax=Gaetbulibacter sp. M240 TaxID=3126511 RepID=UPI00374EFEBD